MKPTAHTSISDLDMMLLHAGWPIADSPKVQQIHAEQMYRSRLATSKKLYAIAAFFAAISKWFELRAEPPTASV